MKIEKLELKHISPYLPYNIRVIIDDLPRNNEEVCSLNFAAKSMQVETLNSLYNIKRIKPILRPLSDLTKEIEHNGERFVPVEKINQECYIDIFLETSGLSYPRIEFRFDWSDSFELEDIQEIIQKLLEWHFDIFNLIENNLAIPKQ